MAHQKSNMRSATAQYGSDSDEAYAFLDAQEAALDATEIIMELNNIQESSKKPPLAVSCCPICRKAGAFFKVFI